MGRRDVGNNVTVGKYTRKAARMENGLGREVGWCDLFLDGIEVAE